MTTSNHESQPAPLPSSGDASAKSFWDLQSPVLWVIASLILLGLFVVPLFWYRLNFDIGLNIYLANAILHGSKLYVDYLETNPPLILWMTAPAVILGKTLGISSITALRVYQILFALGGIWVCWLVLQRTKLLSDVLHRRLFLVALGFAYFPLSGKEFGQREWYLIVLIMPYLLLNAARATGYKPTKGLAAFIGVLGCIGFAIKPFFILVWLALEIYLTFFRKAGFFFRRSESLFVVLGHVLYYLILIPWLYPQYYPLFWVVIELYKKGYDLSMWSVLENTFTRSPEFYFAVLILLTLRATSATAEVRRILAVAMFGLMAVVLVQKKGWDYHIYPMNVAAVMLLLVSVLVFCRSAPEVLAFLRPKGSIVALLVLAVLGAKSFVQADETYWSLSDPQNVYFDKFADLCKGIAKGKPIVMFATQLDPAFPVVNYAEATWGFRHPFLWMVPALYNGTGPKKDGTIYRTRDEMSDQEKFLVDSVVEDISRTRPALIMIDTSKYKVAMDVKFDFLEYFLRDPRFAELWKNYQKLTDYYQVAVYVRNDARFR